MSDEVTEEKRGEPKATNAAPEQHSARAETCSWSFSDVGLQRNIKVKLPGRGGGHSMVDLSQTSGDVEYSRPVTKHQLSTL